MKKILRKIIREYCPNIPVIRRNLNEIKLKEVNRYTMASEDIECGECSIEKQKEIVKKYIVKWPEYCNKLEEKFYEYVQRCAFVAERPDLDDLRIKVLFNCLAYGFMPDEYFVYELEKKNCKEKQSYFSNTDVMDMAYHLNDIVDLGIYFDKYKTYEKFRKYYHREAVCVEKPSDFNVFCAFAEKHPVFVKKNVVLSKGDSVELVDTRSCDKSIRQIFDEMISAGKHIVEEKVIQSKVMSTLSPSSVNTIRCIVFGTDDGIKIGPCFLKVGQGGSFVDNGGKGGILVGIDSETGILNTYGYDEFLTEYPKHPDTQIQFVGYQLPEWDKLRKMVLELSAQTPTVRYVGWDLAHTDKGWIVIEGNGSSQMIGPQIVWKRGFKKDISQLFDYTGG